MKHQTYSYKLSWAPALSQCQTQGGHMGIDWVNIACLYTGEVTEEKCLHKSIRACMNVCAGKNKPDETFLQSLLQAHLQG